MIHVDSYRASLASTQNALCVLVTWFLQRNRINIYIKQFWYCHSFFRYCITSSKSPSQQTGDSGWPVCCRIFPAFPVWRHLFRWMWLAHDHHVTTYCRCGLPWPRYLSIIFILLSIRGLLYFQVSESGLNSENARLLMPVLSPGKNIPLDMRLDY